MIPRHLQPELVRAAGEMPVVTVTGPRQSGKTTLVRAAFPHADYVSLEDPQTRSEALGDPRGFLARLGRPAVIDEAQRAPDLFSYIQVGVDETGEPGQFILSGSQDFLLLRSLSQSLAGRAAVLRLLPLSLTELRERDPLDPDGLGTVEPTRDRPPGDLMETLFRGFYPRIHAAGLDPGRWFADYFELYVQRDARLVLNIGDLEAFGVFVRLAAGRNGQLLDLAGLANDAGISHASARRWLSVLESSYLVTLLRPHFRNFGKRLVKSPKLYFLDTGLLCYLLGVRSPDDLWRHYARGAVFETFVFSELLKARRHARREADLWFWRDAAGHEVDFVIGSGDRLLAVEAKSGQTMSADALKGLRYWRERLRDPGAPAALAYGGDASYVHQGFAIHRWSGL